MQANLIITLLYKKEILYIASISLKKLNTETLSLTKMNVWDFMKEIKQFCREIYNEIADILSKKEYCTWYFELLKLIEIDNLVKINNIKKA